jgi:antitoxin component HigA of HigAB toxin-antitoxin module
MEAIELLSLLGERYADQHWPITQIDPISGVRYLIEKGDLWQPSLVPEFGSESAVSNVFSPATQSHHRSGAKTLCPIPTNG